MSGGMRDPYANHINFKNLHPIIPDDPKVEPCNIDMVWERHGHYLWAEWKPRHKAMKRGQHIVYQNLARRGDTVLMIEYDGLPEDPHVISYGMMKKNGDYKFESHDDKDLKRLLKEFYLLGNELGITDDEIREGLKEENIRARQVERRKRQEAFKRSKR